MMAERIKALGKARADCNEFLQLVGRVVDLTQFVIDYAAMIHDDMSFLLHAPVWAERERPAFAPEVPRGPALRQEATRLFRQAQRKLAQGPFQARVAAVRDMMATLLALVRYESSVTSSEKDDESSMPSTVSLADATVNQEHAQEQRSEPEAEEQPFEAGLFEDSAAGSEEPESVWHVMEPLPLLPRRVPKSCQCGLMAGQAVMIGIERIQWLRDEATLATYTDGATLFKTAMARAAHDPHSGKPLPATDVDALSDMLEYFALRNLLQYGTALEHLHNVRHRIERGLHLFQYPSPLLCVSATSLCDAYMMLALRCKGTPQSEMHVQHARHYRQLAIMEFENSEMDAVVKANVFTCLGASELAERELDRGRTFHRNTLLWMEEALQLLISRDVFWVDEYASLTSGLCRAKLEAACTNEERFGEVRKAEQRLRDLPHIVKDVHGSRLSRCREAKRLVELLRIYDRFPRIESMRNDRAELQEHLRELQPYLAPRVRDETGRFIGGGHVVELSRTPSVAPT